MSKKADQFRAMSDEELEASVQSLRRENFSLKNAAAARSKEAKPHQFRQNRRDVARALTIMGERQRNK